MEEDTGGGSGVFVVPGINLQYNCNSIGSKLNRHYELARITAMTLLAAMADENVKEDVPQDIVKFGLEKSPPVYRFFCTKAVLVFCTATAIPPIPCAKPTTITLT